MNEADLIASIEFCYLGVDDPEGFTLLTERLCHAIGADAGDIVAEDPSNGAITTYGSFGFDPAFLEEYDDAYLGKNPWFANLARFERDRFHTDEIEPPDYWTSRYYNEWVRPQGLHHTVGAVLEMEGGSHIWAGFARSRRGGPFDTETEFLTRLLPHLRRSVRLRRTLEDQLDENAVLSATMDVLAMPVLVLDRNGKTVYANRAAEEFLARSTALRLTRTGRLMAADGRADARIGAAIFAAQVQPFDPDLPTPEPILLSGAEGPASVNVVPLAGTADTGRRGVVAVLIRPFASGAKIEVAAFAAAHDLTRSESRLAEWVALGRCLSSYAEAQGISVGTARWHLKNLEEKTGTSRKEELVALIRSATDPFGG